MDAPSKPLNEEKKPKNREENSSSQMETVDEKADTKKRRKLYPVFEQKEHNEA